MTATTYNVLFLCTGNYYRSRFAEILFNNLAVEAAPKWRASSRALALELGGRNVGPISQHTLAGLAERGIAMERPIRFPRSLQPIDLQQATHVVALKEFEHRAMLDHRFPGWSSRVEFWHVDDVDVALPIDTLAHIEKAVRELLPRLGK